jgi:uncharacterized glyoxalase superfamily protein PhnB
VKPNRSIPDSSVIPELPFPDVREGAEWLCRAFGFEERLQIGDHRAQLVYGDGAVVVIQGQAGPSHVMVRVENADAHRAQAEAAGAKILTEPADHPYGERQYAAEDPAGHIWKFSESIADVDPADWGGTLKG